MTKELQSQLSSIFVCYSDKPKKIEKIFFQKVGVHDPIIDVIDRDNIRHKLWRLTDSALIKDIHDSILNQNLFIADGHHRYKMANDYRKERLKRKASSNGQEPFNYVMTYFTNLDSRDLMIFPFHRVLKKLPKNLNFLEDNFRMDKIKNKDDLIILLAKAGLNEHAFGLYTKNDIYLLRLKNKMLVNKIIKEGSADYKNLDATILKYFILDKLGVVSDDIIYSKDYDEVTQMVDNNQAEASFILNSVKINQLKAIALNGEKMPPKTTYFYPKVLSGLTVYKMD